MTAAAEKAWGVATLKVVCGLWPVLKDTFEAVRVCAGSVLMFRLQDVLHDVPSECVGVFFSKNGVNEEHLKTLIGNYKGELEKAGMTLAAVAADGHHVRRQQYPCCGAFSASVFASATHLCVSSFPRRAFLRRRMTL